MDDVGGRKESGRVYFRVRTQLAIRMQPVKSHDRERLEWEITRGETREESQIDPDLASWLGRIESKLDRILLHVGAESEELRPTEVHSVVLSGGGISVLCERKEDPQTLLLVDFELPGAVPYRIRCLASVVSATPSEQNGTDLAMSYVAINERDREAIVRFTLDVERGELRSRSADRDES